MHGKIKWIAKYAGYASRVPLVVNLSTMGPPYERTILHATRNLMPCTARLESRGCASFGTAGTMKRVQDKP